MDKIRKPEDRGDSVKGGQSSEFKESKVPYIIIGVCILIIVTIALLFA